VVTPLRSQQELASRLIDHWVKGWGAVYNPTRKEALSLVRMAEDLEEIIEGINAERAWRVKTIATAARHYKGARSYGEITKILQKREDGPFLILFGTGWGLARELIEGSDYILASIEGRGYNHLSVRTAAAIILDRLLGGREQ